MIDMHDALNPNFRDYMIVSLTASDDSVSLRTFDALHGSSERFVFVRSALNEWLSSPTRPHFYDEDLNNTAHLYVLDDHVLFDMKWLSRKYGAKYDITGYSQRFSIPLNSLILALLGHDAKLLYREVSPIHAAMEISENAQAQIGRLLQRGSRYRRALSKGLRDNFVRSFESHVTLYADYDGSFLFDDDGIIGGFVLGTDRVIGKDGIAHEALRFTVHT